MTKSIARAVASESYVGADVLEIMQEARNYLAWLTRMLAAQAAGARVVLDFGAGDGSIAARLSAMGVPVVCMEPDARLRQAVAQEGLPTMADLPTDGSVDMVYSLNVLEHIEDDRAALQALYGALRPGGKLVIYVPAFMALYGAFDRRIGHFRRYTRRDLAEKLETAGFVVLQTVYSDSLGYFAALAYRFFGPADGALHRRPLIFYDRCVFPLSSALDRLFGSVVGKNVLAVARKPEMANRDGASPVSHGDIGSR